MLPFVDVDRASRTAFQAGIEEARWVRNAGALGERELHDLLVGLAGADNPVVRPDRYAGRIRRLPPFPLLDHLGVGLQDQRPHAGESLAAPIAQSGLRGLGRGPGSRLAWITRARRALSLSLRPARSHR